MTADIKWGAPPPSKSGPGSGGKFIEIADALRERPGEWAFISGDEGIKNPGNLHKYQGFSSGGFEFQSRQRDDGSRDVWARFKGEPA